MGYEKGRGLGASGSGRLEPVEASQQRGRRGLGHSVPKPKESLAGLEWKGKSEVNADPSYSKLPCQIYSFSFSI